MTADQQIRELEAENAQLRTENARLSKRYTEVYDLAMQACANSFDQGVEKFWHDLENSNGGLDCPCCKRFAKIYRNALNSGYVRILIWLYNYTYHHKHAEGWDGWVHIPSVAPRWVLKLNQIGKLVLWKMAKRKPLEKPQENKTCSGIYRITDYAVDFLIRRALAHAHITTYQGDILSKDAVMIDAQTALGKKWDLQELMNTPGILAGDEVIKSARDAEPPTRKEARVTKVNIAIARVDSHQAGNGELQ